MHLKLAVAAERLGVCGQTSGVPAVVTWELTCSTGEIGCRYTDRAYQDACRKHIDTCGHKPPLRAMQNSG